MHLKKKIVLKNVVFKNVPTRYICTHQRKRFAGKIVCLFDASPDFRKLVSKIPVKTSNSKIRSIYTQYNRLSNACALLPLKKCNNQSACGEFRMLGIKASPIRCLSSFNLFM